MTATLPSTVPSATTPPSARTGRLRPRHGTLGALLAATALLYLWGLSASGWANGFYSAAAQAAGVSWKAWFFGSSDAANWITVDKTPAALWVGGLAVRVFGLSSWSVLAPQAVMGVATVALLYASLRRSALAAGLTPRLATGAALFGGAALAVTPVAVLIFRFNNPDALLTLLLVAAGYAALRAVERGGTRWLLLAAALVGFGFLAKMLQAFLVLPALALVWLVAAPIGWGRRLRDLALAAAALVVSAGWWVLVVELWPADDRPYVGGSQTDSVLELALGYNGIGRLTGDEVGSVGGAPGGGWGETGLARLFGAEFAGQAAWLLPAALLALGALLWWTRRAACTDTLRAAALVWGGWLVFTGLTFSLMAGIIHPYYVVVLAPPIAALVALGGAVAWRDRARLSARLLLGGRRGGDRGLGVRAVAADAVVAAVVGVDSVGARRRRGGGPVGGPPGAAGARRRRPSPWPWRRGSPRRPATRWPPPRRRTRARSRRPGRREGWVRAGGLGRRAGSAAVDLVAAGSRRPAGARATGRRRHRRRQRRHGRWRWPARAGRRGLLGSPTPSAQVVTLLQRDAGTFTWAAAAVGSNTAAGYQLATGLPVMAVGGFNGTDPSPTLTQFQALVAAKKIHWFVGGAGSDMRQSGGSDNAAAIARWVQQHYAATTVGGTTLYDLSRTTL